MKKKIISIILSVLLATIVLAGCGVSSDASETEFFAMDTIMNIKAYGNGAEEAIILAEAEVNRLDSLLTVGDDTSEVMTVNHAGGGVLLDDTAAIVEEALTLYDMTDGCFDITVYPLVRAWGFYSGETRVPTNSEISALLALVGSDKLTYDGKTLTFQVSDMAIDLGGIAKGYASNKVAGILSEKGVDSAIISLGGNVHALGTKPDGSLWKVAIQDPEDLSSYIGIVEVRDKAVVTSGGYQRFFEEDGVRYHHILDPKTGYPAENGLISVSVVCDDGLLADGLSTALFVMGTDGAISFWRSHSEEFDAIFVTEDGQIRITSGLDGIFTSDVDFEVIGP